MPVPISILGVTGKMGKSVLLAAARDSDICVVGGTTRPQSAAIGTDLGELLQSRQMNVSVQSNVEQALFPCAIAIDFSVREATVQHVHAAQNAKKALLIGTTGLSPEQIRIIENAAQDIPIILSANFSLGMVLCLELAATFGKTLFGHCAIDIVETHHVHKKDRPSGTALSLAQAIGKGKIVYDDHAEPRNKEEIVIHSIRSGETVGEHLLVFECGHERMEIKHTAHSREAFAQGALRAAKKLVAKPAGLYSLKDLFIHE